MTTDQLKELEAMQDIILSFPDSLLKDVAKRMYEAYINFVHRMDNPIYFYEGERITRRGVVDMLWVNARLQQALEKEKAEHAETKRKLAQVNGKEAT